MIPTWVVMPYLNNHEQTRQAMLDVLAQTVPVRLLLIANGGEKLPDTGDGTLAMHWHYNPPLLSLSAVWNRALRFVWESGGTEALVVNNDVRLHAGTVDALQQVQRTTGAWFVTAMNVAERFDARIDIGEVDPTSRGGPDFSCFLIQKECHRWFQFDERFQPAYHEDNDYHRRLQLAGFGDRIFSVCVPYHHFGSGTLKANESLRAGWGPKFDWSRNYYRAKWGGYVGDEQTRVPFGTADPDADVRAAQFGQGRGELEGDAYLGVVQYLKEQDRGHHHV